MVYGYVRISTQQQSLDRQVQNIKKKYESAIIVKEIYTGTTTDRKEWGKLYKVLKKGDTVVFDEVSRMSRNADEGFALYKDLYKKDINLVFLKEPYLDTLSYKNALDRASIAKEAKINAGQDSTNHLVSGMLELCERFLLEKADEDIKKAFEMAQLEVDYLHQRTREGMSQARMNGKQIGRPPGKNYETKKSKKAKQAILAMSKEFSGSLSDLQLMDTLGLSRNTYYKYKRELKESQMVGKLP